MNKNSIALGTYVEVLEHFKTQQELYVHIPSFNYTKGRVIGIDTSSKGTVCLIKTGFGGKNKVYAYEAGLRVITEKQIIAEINNDLSANKAVNPATLREAFAKVLGVKDATGWKTGEAIIEEIWGKGV